MNVQNHFIDESVMSPSGEPLEYVPVFSRESPGLVVNDASQDEWDEAVKALHEVRRL